MRAGRCGQLQAGAWRSPTTGRAAAGWSRGRPRRGSGCPAARGASSVPISQGEARRQGILPAPAIPARFGVRAAPGRAPSRAAHLAELCKLQVVVLRAAAEVLERQSRWHTGPAKVVVAGHRHLGLERLRVLVGVHPARRGGRWRPGTRGRRGRRWARCCYMLVRRYPPPAIRAMPPRSWACLCARSKLGSPRSRSVDCWCCTAPLQGGCSDRLP